MSKFLKFIVHFVIVCTIVLILGMALPPFFGVTTVIVDSADKASNLPMGSVTYAIPVRTEEAMKVAGTPILVKKDSMTYRYNLINVDTSNNTGTVIDPSASAQSNIMVSVKNWVPKVVVTIPFVGYILTATESTEGLIVLGLVVLFLIILYVVAELLKKEPEDEYEDLVGERRHVKTAKELRMEEKERAKRMDEEDRELLYGEKARRKQARKVEKKRKKIRTGAFVDEIYEDDLEEEPTQKPMRPVRNVQMATSEAHELLKREIAAATAEDDQEYDTVRGYTEELPEIQEPEEEPEEEKPVEIKKMAIPSYSASQLADKARKAGDAPDIVRDSITKVTLFDYSDIIGGDEESEE